MFMSGLVSSTSAAAPEVNLALNCLVEAADSEGCRRRERAAKVTEKRSFG
jgi:hypothetical protein